MAPGSAGGAQRQRPHTKTASRRLKRDRTRTGSSKAESGGGAASRQHTRAHGLRRAARMRKAPVQTVRRRNARGGKSMCCSQTRRQAAKRSWTRAYRSAREHAASDAQRCARIGRSSPNHAERCRCRLAHSAALSPCSPRAARRCSLMPRAAACRRHVVPLQRAAGEPELACPVGSSGLWPTPQRPALPRSAPRRQSGLTCMARAGAGDLGDKARSASGASPGASTPARHAEFSRRREGAPRSHSRPRPHRIAQRDRVRRPPVLPAARFRRPVRCVRT